MTDNVHHLQPWRSEPDHAEWEAHGLACRIQRNVVKALCGYVGVPAGHPLHGRDDGFACGFLGDRNPHGGVSFAGEREDGRGLWWVGFNCAQVGDLVPGMQDALRGIDKLPWPVGHPMWGVYRDFGYVRGECEKLAGALAAVARPTVVKFKRSPAIRPLKGKPE